MTLSETQASRRPLTMFGLYRWLRVSPPNPNHLLCMPCSLPRWIGSVLSIVKWRAPAPGSSRTALAFPYTTDGRLPRHSFRGLLELHGYYGLQIRSPTFRGLGCEA